MGNDGSYTTNNKASDNTLGKTGCSTLFMPLLKTFFFAKFKSSFFTCIITLIISFFFAFTKTNVFTFPKTGSKNGISLWHFYITSCFVKFEIGCFGDYGNLGGHLSYFVSRKLQCLPHHPQLRLPRLFSNHFYHNCSLFFCQHHILFANLFYSFSLFLIVTLDKPTHCSILLSQFKI